MAVDAHRRALHGLDERIAQRRAIRGAVSQHRYFEISQPDAIEVAAEELEDLEGVLIGDEPELQLAACDGRDREADARTHLPCLEPADGKARKGVEAMHDVPPGLSEDEAVQPVVGGHALLVRRDELAEHALLVRVERAHGVVEAVQRHALVASLQGGEHPRQIPRRIAEDVEPAEERPRRAASGDLEIQVALGAETHGRTFELVLRTRLPDHQIRRERPDVALDERRQRRIADHDLSLDQEGDVAVERGVVEERLDRVYPRQAGPLIVGRAATPDGFARDPRIEVDSRVIRHARGVGRDVVVVEEEHLPLARHRPPGPHDGVRALARYDLDREAERRELAAKPLGAPVHPGRVSTPRWDAAVVGQLVEEAREVGVDVPGRRPPLGREGHLSNQTYLTGIRWFTNEKLKPLTYGWNTLW